MLIRLSSERRSTDRSDQHAKQRFASVTPSKSNRRNARTIAKMMKLLPLLAALLVVAEPIAASRLPSGRAFLPPKATTNVENDNLSSRKHRNVRSSVLDIPRGGVGPLPVEDTAKVASAICK